jgi:ceramide glucosyltransferase
MKEADIPPITVIRPVSGLDPRLYECLASSLRQTYPKRKIDNVFCVASRSDPAYPILERLVRDFPDADVHITVEEEDPLLKKDRKALGPNPKIRNMSRAYREAKGELVWILDCNVWVGKGIAARFVDLLCGYSSDNGGKRKTKFKFVHQTPLTVDLDAQNLSLEERKELLSGKPEERESTTAAAATTSSSTTSGSAWHRLLQRGGGRLDEAFMSSAHAKFYQAINTVKVAPCIMGKSTMFRRAHLDYVTASHPSYAPGIDFFSDNICEDHLIGDALWKLPQAFEKPGYVPVSNEEEGGGKWGKHEMLFGDLCFQPISHTSVAAYLDRRVRWLRVRKYTVTLATFVEPGTESIVCGFYGAYALTTLPFFSPWIPPTWLAFTLIWFVHMAVWCAVDYIQYLLLHSAKTVEIDNDTPDFVLPQGDRAAYQAGAGEAKPLLADAAKEVAASQTRLRDGARRNFREFFFAWLGREALALPVWVTAFWGGATVEWRGRRFYVGLDTKVHEIVEKEGGKDGGAKAGESKKGRK